MSLLDRYRFRVVVLSRHPLDVLISILHFAPRAADGAVARGRGGRPDRDHDALPCSQAFLEYATGPRAAALLGVSHKWRRATGCHNLRYEDLVHDPAGELMRLGEGAQSAGRTRGHRQGNRRQLTEKPPSNQPQPAFLARSTGPLEGPSPRDGSPPNRTRPCRGFESGWLRCDPDESLDRRRADANWFQLELENVQKTLAEARAKLATSPDRPERNPGGTPRLAEESRDEIQLRLEATAARLTSIEYLDGASIRVAQCLHRYARRFPRLALAVRRLMAHELHGDWQIILSRRGAEYRRPGAHRTRELRDCKPSVDIAWVGYLCASAGPGLEMGMILEATDQEVTAIRACSMGRHEWVAAAVHDG